MYLINYSNHDPLRSLIKRTSVCAFADRKRATNELKKEIDRIFNFSIEVVCSFFHDMYALSCTPA